MSDVVTKLRISEGFHNGNVVIVEKTGSGMDTLRSTGHDYSDQVNSGEMFRRYKDRFDDPTYYTA